MKPEDNKHATAMKYIVYLCSSSDIAFITVYNTIIL